jgi:hypothetical protein
VQLLTFLDDASYPVTHFVWQNKRFRGRFSPAATARFLKTEKILVFLTAQAQANIWTAFEKECPPNLPIQQVPIPAGSSDEELWLIARTVNRSIPDGAEIALDISHGPLSFPLMGLMASFFMRIARNVKLKAIFFAAYGIDIASRGASHQSNKPPNSDPAGYPSIKPGETPVFDLNPMLVWLDWFTAIERFNRTGRSHSLIEQLRLEQSRLSRQAQGNRDQLALISGMGKLAGAIDGVSSALDIIRPELAMQHAADIPARVSSIKPIFTSGPSSLIYELLSERLIDNFSRISLAPDAEEDRPARIIAVQRNLINWYAEREFWIEAATLAREWLVSWTMFELGLVHFTNRRLRQRVENALGAEAQDFLSSRNQKIDFQPLFLRDIPQTDQVFHLWLQLTDVRNDINHAGMRERPGQPKQLIAAIKSCLVIINELPIGSLQIAR